MIKSKVIFRAFAFLFSVTGIALNMYVCSDYRELFSYFTLLSNVICLIMLGLALRSCFRKDVFFKGEGGALFRGGCTVCITLTFLVYHFLLRSPDLTLLNLGNTKVLSDIFVHYIVPVCVIVDYLLFYPKGKFKTYFPFLWLIFPILYLCYLPFYSATGGRFIVKGQVSKVPYFFLDRDVLGNAGVARWILIIASAFLLLSFFIVIIDHILARKRHVL